MTESVIQNTTNLHCELCQRVTGFLTEHHLIPRATHSKKVKREYGRECNMRKAMICVACHRQVHYLFSNKQLGKSLNSIDLLKTDTEVDKYIQWIKNKPDDFVPRKGKRKH